MLEGILLLCRYYEFWGLDVYLCSVLNTALHCYKMFIFLYHAGLVCDVLLI